MVMIVVVVAVVDGIAPLRPIIFPMNILINPTKNRKKMIERVYKYQEDKA